MAARVTVFAKAAGATDGEARLFLHPRNKGAHALDTQPSPDTVKSVLVPVTRLDTALRALQLQADEIGLIWIDVEGAEAETVKGLGDLIGQIPLAIEYAPERLRPSNVELRKLLESHYPRLHRLGSESRGEEPIGNLARVSGMTDILFIEPPMPGAGTDKTRKWTIAPAPVVVLVEPQLGENIGAVARAMANFGLSRLRLVKPVQGWPNPKAAVMAAGADRVLDAATLHDSLQAAIADCSFVAAATARGHDQAKPVVGPDEAARLMAPRVGDGETVAIVFGRERNGLENHEVGLADVIVTLPINPAFASLNLAQAVVIVAYEWFRQTGGALPFVQPDRSPPAPKEQLLSFFDMLEAELEKIEYFRPAEKRGTMVVNMRNIFTRMQLTRQDIRTLHGVIMAIAEGRKGPARGGVLDGTQAETLRALLAQRA